MKYVNMLLYFQLSVDWQDVFIHIHCAVGSVWLSHWDLLMSVNTWVSNYTYYKVCFEIIHPFPNFNSAAVELLEMDQ